MTEKEKEKEVKEIKTLIGNLATLRFDLPYDLDQDRIVDGLKLLLDKTREIPTSWT